eukprot:TRINITY_DN35291_c0_g1_i1.p1 TRINITY_DN35291_c0_g1~~TRINITY_DN35291_c0_g1_i1.p1  ORF type:complete len:157 (+),score=29.35 TRINITY_DN35291_c0_g1_i1:200-670(+)
MFRTALTLLTVSAVSCMVEFDQSRSLLERHIADWEVAMNSGDTSGLWDTFSKEARVCFNAECGVGLSALEPVLRKYDSFSTVMKPGGAFTRNYAWNEMQHTIQLNGCTTKVDGVIYVYFKDGKIFEEHVFCDPFKVTELFTCAGIIPAATTSGDEL